MSKTEFKKNHQNIFFFENIEYIFGYLVGIQAVVVNVWKRFSRRSWGFDEEEDTATPVSAKLPEPTSWHAFSP